MQGKPLTPDKIERVLARLAAGQPISTIISEEHCHYQTIMKLREQHPEKLEQWRKLAAARTQAAVHGLMDKIIDRIADPAAMDNERIKDLALSYGILTDKTLTLHGEASSIVEHKSGLDVNEARKALEMAQKRIQGEAIDI